ncbi:unnamed protein product [Schistosoma margrebowiei]|uniref:Uncharacterized protein n=1 Tax=Schistosoma margrebowiei TaxID=48269 RepID=A0A3P8H9I7_9TREM|nr:unnamed protein product [Schistosoma margrebowiei]
MKYYHRKIVVICYSLILFHYYSHSYQNFYYHNVKYDVVLIF